MRKVVAGLTGLAVAGGLVLAFGIPNSNAEGADGSDAQKKVKSTADELPNPLEDKRRELREQGLNDVLTGKAKKEKRGASTVVKVGEKPAPAGSKTAKARSGGATGTVDQYVELSREKTDKIFVILAEFGNERHPDFPDEDSDPDTPGPSTFDGPLHNKIPEPDRTKDNSTVWQKDSNRDFFQDLYFGKNNPESVRGFYEKQSSGRYSVDGQVNDWVKVKYNEARYGRDFCGSNVCNNTWELIKDAVNQWVADREAAGDTPEQIAEQLAAYDQWDRYDYDGDGDFNEKDGYLDHFQIVHAGGDQADGDPIQGEDAIWSHRWYAFGSDAGNTGPDFNKLGGAQIGETGMWVGDYTIQPENGGVSVFCHEYGHDLGLPDHYDTSGGGENSVNWWTIMAQSRVSAKDDEGIGTRAADFGVWDKLQLGWLDYEVVVAGQEKKLVIGPHEYNSAKPQGVVVVLPDKTVTTDYGKPFAGENQWWSEKGDDLDNTMSRELDFTGKAKAEMTFKTRYAIEQDFDYLYVQASTDGGQTWTSLDGTVGGKPFTKDASGAPALTGEQADWADAVVPMDSLAGKKVMFRYRYKTDGGVAENGFFADDIKVTADGAEVLNDGAETGENGWALEGFKTTTGTETNDYDNFYLASNRTYESFDQYMKTGPYNFGYADSKPDWTEHFPYQNGLLVSYWDESQADNNTSEHPGQALWMPIDANPAPIYDLEGKPWRPRVSGYDAPFGKEKSDSFTLHQNGKPMYVRGQSAKPVFDDTKQYWFEETPTAGVKLPAVGVGIKVLKQDGTSMTIQVFSTK